MNTNKRLTKFNSRNKKQRGVITNLPRSIVTQPVVNFVLRGIRADATIGTEFVNVASVLSCLIAISTTTTTTAATRVFDAFRINKLTVYGTTNPDVVNHSYNGQVVINGGEYGRDQKHVVSSLENLPGKFTYRPDHNTSLGSWYRQGQNESQVLFTVTNCGGLWTIDLEISAILADNSITNGKVTVSVAGAAGLYAIPLDGTNAAGTATGTNNWVPIGWAGRNISSIP